MQVEREEAPAEFGRLRDYCRKGRAPWRRDAQTMVFLTTREEDAAPDIRLSPPDFAAALRQQFSTELTQGAVWGLAQQSPIESAYHVLTAQQTRLLGLAALLAAGLLAAFPKAMAATAFALIAALFLVTIGVRLSLAMIAAAPAAPLMRVRLKDADLPVVTVLTPLFREAEALPSLASALAKLDYPQSKLDIKFLLEENDQETIAEARRLNRDGRFDLVIVPASAPQTKPKAMNYALPTARGDLLVIYDAEDEPEPMQLRIAAETFAAAPPDLACLQAKLNYYNAPENWLTQLFALEYCLWYDHLLPALDRIGAPAPLGGTSNIFRTEILIDAGGWDAHNVTEDADLGLRLAARGYRTAIIDSTTYEEANCRVPNWLRQRSRWMKGFMQTWLVHRRGRNAGAAEGWRRFLTIDLFIGGAVAAALVNPLLWGASIAELLTEASAADLLPAPFGGAATLALAVGNLLLIALAAYAPWRRGLGALSLAALMTPVYWLMMSAAAYLALWQLLSRPHHWEKTEHGLSESAGARRRNALRSLGFD
ncbi:MAG: glycosyltransferase [Parvularculaceae bacterium]|nr:glycosyltransferase [Parvularculaceae bacterium]